MQRSTTKWNQLLTGINNFAKVVWHFCFCNFINNWQNVDVNTKCV